jgi:hypothetical protein
MTVWCNIVGPVVKPINNEAITLTSIYKESDPSVTSEQSHLNQKLQKKEYLGKSGNRTRDLSHPKRELYH